MTETEQLRFGLAAVRESNASYVRRHTAIKDRLLVLRGAVAEAVTLLNEGKPSQARSLLAGALDSDERSSL